MMMMFNFVWAKTLISQMKKTKQRRGEKIPENEKKTAQEEAEDEKHENVER
jgi:hypothetical protein